MSNNLSLGPIQCFDNSVVSINLALQEVLERIDQLKGLRGRSEIWDRARVSTPSADTDAVDLQSLVTQEYRWRVSLLGPSGGALQVSLAPGTSYVEVSSQYRQSLDLSSLTSTQGRILVAGYGTGSGSGKGVAMTDSSGAVLAEVTWDGNSESIFTGTFTDISETTDQQVQLRAKGADANESLVLRYVVAEIKGTVQVVST